MLKSKILVSAISALITLSSIFVAPATYAVKVSKEIHQTNDLPKVLKNYKNFHDEIYNQKKDSEKYTDEEIRVIENFLRKAVDESDFSIAVSVDLIDSIIENDKFQSVVERCWDFIKEDSEYDETCLTRRFAPQEFFNVNVKNLVKSDYEKYGYLSCKDKRQDFLDSNQLVNNYGNIIVNFKKENLKIRTTMTIGDSLNQRHRNGPKSVTPTLVSDPKLVCIPGYSKDAAELLLNSIKDGNLLTNRPNLLERTKCYEYFELQFHGDLSFKEDVESVDIIRTYIEDENEREAQYKQQEMLAENIKKQGKICNIIDCTDIV